jgi:ribosomal-protein-alanine N-acetyltransferase
VLAIERASFKIPWSRRLFLAELSMPLARDGVALQQPSGMVLGYICLWLVADEAQVHNLAVHPAFRGRGVGRWLLVSALREVQAAGARQVTLEVRAGNLAAQRLYSSLGFVQQGVRPGYYRKEGEDALLLGRALAGLPAAVREKP